jgi:hypothetical protein
MVGADVRQHLSGIVLATGAANVWDPSPDNLVYALAVGSVFAGGSFDSMGVAPLPVELTSFTAFVRSTTVLLEWTTATELNNYGFEILRSAQNDNNEWKTISFVNGNGNSNSTKNYSFEDKNVQTGRYLYRLKQIDTDGSFEYSSGIEVEIESPKEFALLQNYPNPFNPSTTIRFTLPDDGWVSLKVYNTLGQEVTPLYEGEIEKGYHSLQWNGQDIFGENVNSGIYFYSIVVRNNSSASSSQLYSKTGKMVLLR